MEQPSTDHRIALSRVERKASFELPRHARSEKVLCELLASAGVTVGGTEPWDIRVLDEGFYDRVLSQGSLGLGESYMDGWWECDRVDEFCARLLRAHSEQGTKMDWRLKLATLEAKLFNQQTPEKSTEVAKVHYDLGNAFFERMLGSSMAYSCAVWDGADTLEQAQTDKFDLICKKLDLQKTDRLLDIGCGWGGLARHAAEHYGCSVAGITISQRQYEYATAWCRGLPVQIVRCDYRSPEVTHLGTFNKLVSVGMFEHVGSKNYLTFMRMAHAMLQHRGIFVLQCIGTHGQKGFDPWIDRYIFPHSHLPNPSEITEASAGLFVLEDWQNLGAHYDRTLMAWHANFEAYARERGFPYDRRFYRMWRYYLLCCAASFRVRDRSQLYQVAFSHGGLLGGYGWARSA